MITFVISTNEITHTTEDYGGRKYYYCKDADLVSNADGSFKINNLPVPARDADIAYTKDTQRCLMYDADIDAFWEQ